jgi:hypothetical protein
VPLAVITYTPDLGRIDMAHRLADVIPQFVAEVLTVEENSAAQITVNEVEVWVRESGINDINSPGLGIIVWANYFPERAANLEQRKYELLAKIRTFLSSHEYRVQGYVWIMLSPAAFGEI